MYGLVRAPELQTPGLHWLNVESPPRLIDLRGRLVILDFWTYCCINCHHMLPTLARVEETYPDHITVIGIHSPKFEAERDPAAVAHAIRRHDIRHAVALDTKFGLWQEYCVKAWPTLAFITPDGRLMGNMSGEPDPDKLMDGIDALLNDWQSAKPLPFHNFAVTPPATESGAFLFPAKIKPLTLPWGEAGWAVTDTGHHQIVLLDDAGQEHARFGRSNAGFDDGDGADATFNAPQGIIAAGDTLFVADTGNHAIRAIDLNSAQVTTVAGTGKRGLALDETERPALATDLASPWDLAWRNGELFFANTGTHQLGVLDTATRSVRLLAGSSVEDILDGRGLDARLAQPSGLALSPDGKRLAFADAETSAVRLVHLGDGNRVETLVGTGLFDFGHVNGPFKESVLQHPLGICWDGDGHLIVADSYNNRLRRLDLRTRQITDVDEHAFTFADDIGTPLLPNGEPVGVWATADGRFRVCDTNHHRILDISPNDKTVRVWAE